MEYLKSSNLTQDAQVQQAIKENSINTRQKTFKAVTFAQFSKRLEYRSRAVYLSGKHLFNKVNSEINLLNEKLFYSLFISGQLNY
jgi:hypothetical protein